jgi:hypothetical protein
MPSLSVTAAISSQIKSGRALQALAVAAGTGDAVTVGTAAGRMAKTV